MMAMFLSLFHLGKPFRAYRAMTNLPVSWLSWEIFLSAAFLILWVAVYWMDISGTVNLYLLGAAALAGLMNVISMSNIYSSTGRPGWKGIGTYLDFLGSMIVLGIAGSAFMFFSSGLDIVTMKALANQPILVALIILAVQLAAWLTFVSRQKASVGEFSLDKLACSSEISWALLKKYLSTSLAGWLFSFLGIAIVYANINGLVQLSLLLPLIFVFAGELIKRYGFFMLVGESEDSSQYISAVSYSKNSNW
jgi:anaerobic dimethyl sulfoxide reductase subunit C (anchor subunit)